MARARERRRLSADDIETAVVRIMRCQARRLAAAIREDAAAAETEVENLERIRADLPARGRDAVDRVVLLRSQLQGAGDTVQRKAIARRHIVNEIDGLIDAISILAPKTLQNGEWHHADVRDEQLITAIFEFLRRFDLVSLLNEKRDRHFAEHHARLATFPKAKEQFYEHLDALGAEQDAARKKTLEAVDLDWIEEVLLREQVAVNGTTVPVRVKDVAKAMKISESARRVRKHRRARKPAK